MEKVGWKTLPLRLLHPIHEKLCLRLDHTYMGRSS